MAASFGAAAKNVRGPHMERNGRNLEGEAGEQEDQSENQAGAGVFPGEDRGDLLETCMDGEAVDQRTSVKQHARRQRAQHEILQARLRRTQGIPVDRGNDIKREALEFDPHIKRNQIAGGDHHQHAEGRQHDEDRIFEFPEPLGLHETVRHDDGDRGRGKRQDFHEAGEFVGNEAAAERGRLHGRDGQNGKRASKQKPDTKPVDGLGGMFAAKHAEHEECHRAHGQDDFRERRDDVGCQEGRVHGLSPYPASAPQPALSPQRRQGRSCSPL